MNAKILAVLAALAAGIALFVRRRNENARDEAELWAEATDQIR